MNTNTCHRCQRTYESEREYEHGCEVNTRDHGTLFVCGSCTYGGEHAQWRDRQLIEQIAELTIRRILAQERATAT